MYVNVKILAQHIPLSHAKVDTSRVETGVADADVEISLLPADAVLPSVASVIVPIFNLPLARNTFGF